MKSWLLKVAAIAILSVLLELILSEGKMKKYISGIIRVVLVFSLISPIFGLINGKIDLSFDTNTDESVIQEQLYDNLMNERYLYVESRLKEDLKNIGIENSNINIISFYDGAEAGIDRVYVDLSSAVIKEEAGNILLTDKVKTTIKNRIAISEDKIIIYGL